ncbi:MAG: hypothetical protein QXQ02_09120 [Halobacteria archaeon]
MPKKIAIITLMVIVLAAVTGTVTYILKQNQDKGAEKVGQEEAVATLPEKPEIDTSEWQVYRNEKYGFEIKYPPQFSYEEWKNKEWELSLKEHHYLDRVFEVTFKEKNGPALINVAVFPTDLTPREFIRIADHPDQKNIEKYGIWNVRLPGGDTRDLKAFKINDSIQALQFARTYGSAGYNATYTLFQDKTGQRLFYIGLEELEQGGEEMMKRSYSQMFSTFHFIK